MDINELEKLITRFKDGELSKDQFLKECIEPLGGLSSFRKAILF